MLVRTSFVSGGGGERKADGMYIRITIHSALEGNRRHQVSKNERVFYFYFVLNFSTPRRG